MKKCIVMLMLLLSSTQVLQATQYSGELPGGKNYLDPDNFWNQIGDLNNFDTIAVMADQDYVVSVPGESTLANMEIHISGDAGTYVGGRVTDQSNCVVGQSRTYCTFHTSPSETGIDIRFYAYYMDVYYDNNEMDDFQLETGSSPTAYAPYVLPNDGTPPEIQGESAYYTSFETFEALSSIIANHFSAYDDIDGDVSNRILIENDTYSSHEQEVGMYPITLSVSDTSGNRTNYVFTIVVQDTIPPIIDGPDQVTIDIDYSPTIRAIVRENFALVDNYDDRLSPYFIIDDYSINQDDVGEYDVTFSITDSSGNSVEHSFVVVVEDVTKPIYKGLTDFVSYCSDPLSTEDILDDLVIQDNVTSSNDLDVQVITNTFIGNEEVVGEYSLELSITDASLNQKNVVLSIQVIDDIDPRLDGPATLEISYSNPFTIDDLKDLFNVSDNVDDLDVSNITVLNDTYSDNAEEIGVYHIDFKVEDLSGNLTIKQLTISVVDDVPPVIITDEFLVTVNVDTIFEAEDALNLLLNSGDLIQQSYTMSTLVNEYEGHETIPGHYDYSLEFTGEDGEIYAKDFTINVVETSDDSSDSLLVRNILIYSLSTAIVASIIYRLFKKN